MSNEQVDGFYVGYDVQHVAARDVAAERDMRNYYTMEITPSLLSHLLFCDLYAIEEAHVEEGKIHLTARYSGPATPFRATRVLAWGVQQQGTQGHVKFNIVDVPSSPITEGKKVEDE